jgi:hypothetical protein
MRLCVSGITPADLPAAALSIRTRIAIACAFALLSVLGGAASAAAQLPDASSHAGAPMVLVGAGPGSGFASAIAATDGTQIFGGQVFAGFTGGVRVATGDVNGDGIDDLIVATGPGAGFVKVFSGRDLSTLAFFAPFGGGFSGGLYVASGDIDGDGRADIVVGSGSGGLVSAYSGADLHLLGQVAPFGGGYQGGVTVAVGDIDGDGHGDVLAGMVNGGLVTVLSGADAHVIASGYPYGPQFSGGVYLAAGDVNGDGRVDIITGPVSGGTLVQAFSGVDLAVLASYSAYPGANGVTVAAADIDGDGRADIITGPTSGAPLVRVFSVAGQHEVSNFLAFDAGFGGGVFVASDSRFAVVSPPIFVNGTQASWSAGSFSAFAITTRGVPAGATISLSGSLPAGLSFFSGSGRAVISGTPTTAGSTTVTLTATNLVGSTTQDLTISIGGGSSGGGGGGGGPTPVGPAFTTAASARFVIGTTSLFTINAGGVPAAALTRTGALPSGVTFTDLGNGTATLSGTAAAGSAGTYPLTFTASNSAGTVTQNFSLTVDNSPTPVITSAAAATFSVGAFGTFAVNTTASPAVTSITETGALPSGVTFVNNGNGTATLSGTPAAGSNGTYPITFTASNGTSTTQSFTLTVNPASGGAPTITSANAATFVVGSAGTFSITTTGSPTAASIMETGALPSGVTFTNNGNGTATIAGTPDAGSAGNYPLTITASNGVLPDAVQSFTLTVSNVTSTPTFTSASSTTFRVGLAGTFSVTTAAAPAVTSITETGALPAGVTFTYNNNGTATLAGMPAAGTSGAYPLTLTATNGGAPVTQHFTLSVQETATITSASAVTFTVGTAGTFLVNATGTPTPVLTETGALPGGLQFVDNGNGTATLSGTPAAGTGGSRTLTLTATNGVGSPGTQSFTLNINDAGRFTSANSTTFTIGSNGNFLVTTQAFPSAGTITRTGAALPTGVSFNDHGDGTATLSGTPAAGTGGTYSSTFTFSNGVGGPVTQNFTLNVELAPQFTSASSASVTVGTAVNFGVTATGFPIPTITQTGGTLPNGVSFSGSALVGTATQTGAFAPQFTASNGVVPDAVQNFTLTVSCPVITVSPGVLPSGLFNTLYAPVTFTAVGSTGSSFTWSAVGLPAGLSIAPTTGIVSGTPTNTVAGALVTITVTDNFGCIGSVTPTITVRPVAGNDTFNGAVGNTQLAVGAVGGILPSTPTAVISGNVKTNDDGVGAPGALSVVFASTSANSGTIVEGTTDGSFLYTPAAGFAGASDTFTYTLTDGNSVTNMATVTINFLNRVWYVNSSVAGPGDGRSNNPFNTLDKAAAPSLAGDIVYVHTGTGSTTGNLAMDANSTMQGAGGAVSLNGGVLVIPAGTAPTLSGTVTLADNTAIRNVNFSGASPAMTASGLATTVPSVIDGVSVSGGTNALFLSSVTATGTGAINVTNSTFTNTTSAAVLVSGGNVPLSIGAAITQTNAARAIDIQTRSGGAVTFSGAISATGSSTGVFMSTNSGTSAFTFTGGLTLNGASSTFTSTNAAGSTASLTITGTNTIGATTAPTSTALNVANTTIGASGLTFRSISANGASSGIILNATGANGGLTVTGNAGTCTSAVTCTGGAIQNSTADGISITSSRSPSLNFMFISDSTGVATDDGVSMSNITGTVTIANSVILNSPHNGVTIDNNNTSMAGFNFTNTTVQCQAGQTCEPSGSTGNDGLLLTMRGTSVLTTGTISGSTFSGMRSTGVQIQTNDTGTVGSNSGGTIISSLTISNNTFTGNGIGIDIDESQISNLTFQVLNNTLSGAQSHAINVFSTAGTDTGPTNHTFVGKIFGNSIGTQGTKDSGSVLGSGIRVVVQGDATQGVITVDNNTIHEVANADIITFFGQNGNGINSTVFNGSAKFKITNNVMPLPSGSNQALCGTPNTACASNGIFVLADEKMAVCNAITGNNIYDVTTMNGSFDVYLAERAGPPTGAQLTVEGTGGSNMTFIQNNNTLAGANKFIDEGGNTTQVASCGVFP